MLLINTIKFLVLILCFITIASCESVTSQNGIHSGEMRTDSYRLNDFSIYSYALEKDYLIQENLMTWSEASCFSDRYMSSKISSGEIYAVAGLKISEQIVVPYVMEMTSKGNGYLNILNQRLKTYDDHDDGCYYRNSQAVLNVLDINQDGFRDILCWIELEDDLDSNVILPSQSPVVIVYVYDMLTNSYIKYDL